MKFKFKIQPYQTDAVDAVVRIFNGQPNYDKVTYIRDRGKRKKIYDFQGEEITTGVQTSFVSDDDDDSFDLESETGYKNEDLELTDEQILKNVQKVQNENNIKLTDELIKEKVKLTSGGKRTITYPSFDVEMETGTGKTYVYIKCVYQNDVRA